MPSIRITSFGGINTEVSARQAPNSVAQVAHNCLLWDGTLRPLAQWTKQITANYGTKGLSVDKSGSIRLSTLSEIVPLNGSVYVPGTRVGLNYPDDGNNNTIKYSSASVGIRPVGVRQPVIESGGVSYDRGFHSDKPVNRIYAISGIRKEGNSISESVLSIIPNQSPQSIIYEGDNATITALIRNVYSDEYTGFRIYRSISGMDTGSDTKNELDTEWYLIAQINVKISSDYNLVYIDGGSATTDPLDAYLAGDFYPPRPYNYKYLQNTESGWLVAATEDGNISVSERYLYNAWPIENFFTIMGVTVTGMRCQLDTVFIGTQGVPYMLALAAGEKLALQGSITPFPESYPCLDGTMDVSASGAMYASPSGVISLSREGMRRVSAGVASGVVPLYSFKHTYFNDDDMEVSKMLHMRFEHTQHGAYLRGEYFGFCGVPTGFVMPGETPIPEYRYMGYILNTGSTLDGAHAMQQLVTMDIPDKVHAHTIGPKGIYALADRDGVYCMPFPDTPGSNAYDEATKYCYQWKSKKFVFPGQMVMAAAKVVHDCKGFVKLKIYVDCCCVYEMLVHDCQPFTLPAGLAGVEWEVEVHGTAAVHEIHIASSIRELTEHE